MGCFELAFLVLEHMGLLFLFFVYRFFFVDNAISFYLFLIFDHLGVPLIASLITINHLSATTSSLMVIGEHVC